MKFIYDDKPLIVGESKKVKIIGDGPFKVIVSCFVDNPPPAGFKPCAACGDFKVEPGVVFEIDANSDFWKKNKGNLQVVVTDCNNKVDKFTLSIEQDNSKKPKLKTMQG